MKHQIGIATLLWSSSILLSRVIGLVREAVLGRILGGGSAADVYWTAFMVPDFLNYLLAGGVLSLVFIPIFADYLTSERETAGLQVCLQIGSLLTCLGGVGLISLWLLMPWLVKLIAPGFNLVEQQTLLELSRIILPAQLFHVLGGLISATLQAKDKHLLPALAPLVYTLCIILGGLGGGTAAGAYGFAYGVLVGSILGPFGLPFLGALQAFKPQLPALWQQLQFKTLCQWRHPDVRNYLYRSLPIMLGLSIIVADDWFLRRQGSLLYEGAVATLQYSKNLLKVPMGVFGLAAGAATFPALSSLAAAGHFTELRSTLYTNLKRLLLPAFLAEVLLTVAGSEIATIIYGHKIPESQYQEMHLALAVMGLGLWALAAQTLVARGFYALKNTWLPTIIGTIISILAFPGYVYLGRLGAVKGLALASALSISLYVWLLLYALERLFKQKTIALAQPLAPLNSTFSLKIIGTSSFAILTSYLLRIYVIKSYTSNLYLQTFLLISAATVFYLVGIWVLKIEEAFTLFTYLQATLKKRLLAKRA